MVESRWEEELGVEKRPVDYYYQGVAVGKSALAMARFSPGSVPGTLPIAGRAAFPKEQAQQRQQEGAWQLAHAKIPHHTDIVLISNAFGAGDPSFSMAQTAKEATSGLRTIHARCSAQVQTIKTMAERSLQPGSVQQAPLVDWRVHPRCFPSASNDRRFTCPFHVAC